MKRTLAFFLALALTGLPSMGASAAEDYRIGRWEMSLSPGVALPLSTTYNQMTDSGELQLSGGYQLHRYLSAGAEMGWQFNHRIGGLTAGQFSQDYLGDGQGTRAPFSSNINMKIFGLYPYLKFGQWVDVASYKFRPYLIGSAGLYHTWTNSGTITVSGIDQISGKQVGPIVQPYATSSNSYFGFAMGGGFNIQVDENAALGFDLRYSRILRPYDDLQFLTPSLRISYLF